ncbi:exonuclease domain-containing protein [Promicromonospora thailandica]|uniref:DNA polymerase-3 subunit epsilon n=1 Tax=Promicromonospora thailandica TaxID=765201 RepID=A0A9X2G4L0_9MICO|nr:exonuclease domain-containing protein [Promicromonospora thailandica]MCP2265640.1 DNA polymerase-3 subunit epsilon [Promicromonospora thailandica]
MTGYAVVDVETTGLFPGGHDRIAEIAIVRVDPDGRVEDTWTTLVDPGRDLGPQQIHGISAADVRHAPAFADVAGHVADRLRGRTFVAHNAQFDRRFVWHAFAALGYDVPLIEPTTLCTMRTGAQLFPAAPRSLAGACLHHGITLDSAHEALSDARAAAELLRVYLTGGARRAVADWDDVVELAATTPWPVIPAAGAAPVRRGVAAERDTHFLARLTPARDSPATTSAQEVYLELVDRALLDRHISAREHDQLAGLCARLGIGRTEADALHREYLAGLAAAAWSDGVLDPARVTDYRAVAALLEVPAADAGSILDRSAPALPTGSGAGPGHPGRFVLRPGDLVVFTGAMDEPRDVWQRRAAAAGLVPHPAVTKRVRLVVAADPDSMSGKARKADAYGIPVVGEAGFRRALDDLARTPPAPAVP